MEYNLDDSTEAQSDADMWGDYGLTGDWPTPEFCGNCDSDQLIMEDYEEMIMRCKDCGMLQ